MLKRKFVCLCFLFSCTGTAMFVLVLTPKLKEEVKTYMLLCIIVLESLLVLPYLVYYTGRVFLFTVNIDYDPFYLGLLLYCFLRQQTFFPVD